MNRTPLEYDEAVTFAEWLRMKGIKFSHLAQETYTTSWNQKRKNKEMGVQKGVPDYMIVTPEGLLFVELKRVKGGKVSKEQKVWLEVLNKLNGIQAQVCYGADEAIAFVSQFIK